MIVLEHDSQNSVLYTSYLQLSHSINHSNMPIAHYCSLTILVYDTPEHLKVENDDLSELHQLPRSTRSIRQRHVDLPPPSL